MAERRRIEQLTLREMFIDTERLTRELIEHLGHGFLPKTDRLKRLVEPDEGADSAGGERAAIEVEDVTVRNHAAQLLETENFTDELYEQIREYCLEIEDAVTRIRFDE